MAIYKKVDRVVKIRKLKDGRWRVRYFFNGKERMQHAQTEIAAHALADEIRAQIDEMGKGKTPANADVNGNSPDTWERLIWAFTAKVAEDPRDECSQRALRTICAAVNTMRVLRGGEKSSEITGDKIGSMSDEELSGFVESQLKMLDTRKEEPNVQGNEGDKGEGEIALDEAVAS